MIRRVTRVAALIAVGWTVLRFLDGLLRELDRVPTEEQP